MAQGASADEQLLDVALARCELSLLLGAGGAADALRTIDPTALSPIQRVRYDLMGVMAAGVVERRRERFEAAAEQAADLGALHLVQLAAECLARSYGAPPQRALELSERLGMQARPIFRL